MIEKSLLNELRVSERSLLRGMITRAEDDHHFVVRVQQGEEAWLIGAELLVTADSPVRLRAGDSVLCWIDSDDRERGLILGRAGGTVTAPVAESPVARVNADSDDLPDALVLEAKHALTLRVGEGSITIREDGKILIKGKDLVSHAQRMNRIKGGAVSIN